MVNLIVFDTQRYDIKNNVLYQLNDI